MTLKLTIEHDECGVDVWEYDENVKFISNHRDYSSQNIDYTINDFESKEELLDFLGPLF